MFHRRNRQRISSLKPDHARMVQRNMVTSLLLYENIRTTKRRARAIQPTIDRLIALAKRDKGQKTIRAINQVVTDRNASRKLIQVLAKRFEKRPSGFTSIKAVGSRKGDGAELVDLMLLDQEKSPAPEAKPESKKAPAKKKTAQKSDSPSAS